MKKVVVDVLEKALKKKNIKITREEIESKIEVPPSIEMGDYAFPCFFLAKQLKDPPHQIALEIREKIGTEPPTDFDDIATNGPYLNFFLDRKNLARKVVWDAITKKKDYGKGKIGKGKKILFEFSSPNVAKPFGVGHLRSTIIGNSLANIAEFLGYKVIRTNYLGDWGTQFGRILFGYDRWGSDAKLRKDPLEHLMQVYVKANKKSFDKDAKEWFKKLEDKDRKAMMLWKIFKERSIEEFNKIYKEMDVKFDFYTSESETVKYTSDILKQLENKKLLEKSKGAMIVDLNKYNLDVCLVVKSDGATTYVLRDLAEATERHKKYKFDMMVYETGNEQSFYFKQLFKILDLLGYKWANNCFHVDHGLYLDKKGKKFSTRKGKTVFMKDILEETEDLAKQEIKKRSARMSKENLENRARKIAIAAIFYGDLKNNRNNNIVFDPKKFVSFEGDTGPYILYSYARASSIIKKSGQPGKFVIDELENKELEIVQKILQFQDIVEKAFATRSPSLIANYCYDLSKLFNEFYHSCPVIGSDKEPFRLALVEAFRVVLKNALGLLGIETLLEM